jgi:Transient receptor potential (TRP) ion channel
MKSAPADPRQAKLWAASHLRELETRAKQKVGFLFEHYSPSCWYWEVVELGRKLALTSVLALIAPGSAGQVLVGLLIAFFALLANLRLRPYATARMNMMNQTAQLNMFFFLLVGLVLKVDMDSSASSYFYAGIVFFLTIVPVALPILVSVWNFFTEDDEEEEEEEEEDPDDDELGLGD